jgi:hypothetical protein
MRSAAESFVTTTHFDCVVFTRLDYDQRIIGDPMRDGASEDVVPCPHCGTEGDCPHLLTLIDETFNECADGYAYVRYDEFRVAIEDSFGRLLSNGSRKGFKWGDKQIQMLWHHAVENHSSEDSEVSLDPDVLTVLIVDLLKTSGGERYSGPVSDDGGPGFSSVYCLFHAENPERVFDSALSKLKARLRKAESQHKTLS